MDAINPLQPKNMALLSIFCRLPSPFFGSHVSFFVVAISTLSGTTVAHTLYTEEWHRLAKYCRLGKYHNLVRVVASLFSPALALGLQAAHSLRITKWKMPFFTSNKLNFGQTEAICSWYEIYYFLLFATRDKHRHICMLCPSLLWGQNLIIGVWPIFTNSQFRMFWHESLNYWSLSSHIS